MTSTPAPQPPAATDLARVAWHISTHSSNGGRSCVEAGPILDGTARVAIRHSHHPNGTTLTYPTHEWHALLHAIHTGELDVES
ncbi:DUF397 domain-containing protein [Lipingzhangella sp. LS1_29]|uniref:DUF397 domain-containing protein n=1 Tax=Lipingzhangella rawalii TaxID=2055835 RepID=A0ABU2H8S7_9ACTN|nr:DUF397 domain-containing protein [Lipingzhangella rawalii]MDS1271708.1 DUF397 domain-containing protein [Lipingzhangella rawalii]